MRQYRTIFHVRSERDAAAAERLTECYPFWTWWDDVHEIGPDSCFSPEVKVAMLKAWQDLKTDDFMAMFKERGWQPWTDMTTHMEATSRTTDSTIRSGPSVVPIMYDDFSLLKPCKYCVPGRLFPHRICHAVTGYCFNPACQLQATRKPQCVAWQ